MDEMKKAAEGEKPSAEDELKRLLKSETIRLVFEKKYTPGDLDRTLRNMKNKIEEQQYQHFLDMSEVVRLRRYVEFLIGHDNAEV